MGAGNEFGFVFFFFVVDLVPLVAVVLVVRWWCCCCCCMFEIIINSVLCPPPPPNPSHSSSIMGSIDVDNNIRVGLVLPLLSPSVPLLLPLSPSDRDFLYTLEEEPPEDDVLSLLLSSAPRGDDITPVLSFLGLLGPLLL